MRIAVAHFAHETVTFLPNATEVADFTYPGSPASGEALLQSAPKSYLGGFVQVAREYAGVELVGIESPLWPRTGSGSGWVSAAAFETFAGGITTGLRHGGPFDGVYLALHGAMAVRGVARPEAELARRVRAVVGAGVPIAATFDPHANEDEAFLRHADMAFAVKYFPHYDAHLQGQRAARALVRAIRGDFRPAHATVKVPILTPTVVQWTGASPWMDLVQRALVWEARTPDAFVNVLFGFPWADVPDVGMTIQVLTNADAALARTIAEDMAAWAWRRRAALVSSVQIHPIPEAVALARQAVARGEAPVVLADTSDRTGAATWLLREIIAQDLCGVLIATIADAEAVAALAGLAEGTAIDRPVGGRLDASAGAPVPIVGRLLKVPDQAGQCCVCVAFGRGNVLVLTPWLEQVMEPAWIAALGLDVAAFQVIAIKSRVHFRRGFDDSGFAPTILLVEPPEPFLGTVRLDALPYRNVDLSRFYPYGERLEWRAERPGALPLDPAKGREALGTHSLEGS
jgi:microcystin degradation protein MlrC